jgi:tetratricopeptide (TPR) repeat protein
MVRPPLTLLGPLVAVLSVPGCAQPDVAAVFPPATPAPSDPCVVALAAAPDSRLEVDRTIARLQDEARQQPRARRAVEQLGYQYVARARVHNDAGAYTLAEKAAECLESIDPADPSAALLLRGHALHQMHRFHEAEQIARRLIARRQFALDYGLLGDVLMEQGRVAEAADAYQQMIDLKPFYQSYTRAAHLRWLRGDLDGAVELVGMALAAASPRDGESIAWAYTRLGSYQLQRGNLDDAVRAAETALTYLPDYAAALHLRGRVLLAMEQSAEALAPLRTAARLNPLPEYRWTLIDGLRLVGLDAEADIVEGELTARGAQDDPRTLALFLATRRTESSKAINLAEQELKTRQDVFTLDALAWALFAGGRVDEARGFMTRALGEGTRDGRLFLHAAAIAAAAGDGREAARWRARAEETRSMLLPSERTILARLTGTEERPRGFANDSGQ